MGSSVLKKNDHTRQPELNLIEPFSWQTPPACLCSTVSPDADNRRPVNKPRKAPGRSGRSPFRAQITMGRANTEGGRKGQIGQMIIRANLMDQAFSPQQGRRGVHLQRHGIPFHPCISSESGPAGPGLQRHHQYNLPAIASELV